jgi:hypothetical protein
MRDYSDTICIQYGGGYGGDFFSHLINRAVNPRSKIRLERSRHSKWLWRNSIYPPHYDTFKLIENILNEYSSFKSGLYDRYELAHDWSGPFTDQCRKLVHVLYSENKGEFVDTYVDLLRSAYMEPFPEDYYRIYNFHYKVNKDFFCIQMAYPGCASLYLWAASERHKIYFRILDIYKNALTYYDERKKYDEKTIREYVIDYNINNKPTFPTTVIDIGDLIFNRTKESIVTLENQLTSVFGRTIILNRDLISEYRENNRRLINNFLKVEDADSLSIQDLLEKIVQAWMNYE